MLIQKLLLTIVVIFAGMACVQAQKISVTGKALNAKLGAIVMTEDGKSYYIDGLNSWDKLHYDKKVKVSGVLVIDSSFIVDGNNKEKSTEPIRAGTNGPIKVIKKAKWILIK